MNSKNKNCCGNCKHFKQHYYWYDGELKKTCSGHCTEYRRIKLVMLDKCCEKWEFCENVRMPSNDDLNKILRQTAKQIGEIAAILKTDN